MEIQKWSLWAELEDPCLDGNPRIWRHLSQCVRTPQQLVGFVFGCLALGFWFASHIGVLARRHRAGVAEERVPPAHHLLHEAGADVLNCLGAVLSHQLGTQILFSVYLLCMDALFMVQYLVLKTLSDCTGRGIKAKTHKDPKPKHPRTQAKLHTWPLCVLLLTSAGWVGLPLVTWHLNDQSESTIGHRPGRVLLSVDNGNQLSGTVRLGYVVGYLSVLFHWTSSLPTAIKTFQDRKMPVNALICTSLGILGNLCYVTSVFCHYTDAGFLVHTLPWTLGRLGMIGIDSGLVLLSVVSYCRGTAAKSELTEIERLLGARSEDDSESDGSDTWERPADSKRGRKVRRAKATNRLTVPRRVRDTSDTDLSPQRSPSLYRHRFTTPTLAPPSVDIGSDCSGENEWRPAWTEEDVQGELVEEQPLTEEQVFALLAQEDDRKRELTGTGNGAATGSDSQSEANLLKRDRGSTEAVGGEREGRGQGEGSGEKEGEGQVCWFDEGEAFINVGEEEIVDMQKDNGGTSINGQQ